MLSQPIGKRRLSLVLLGSFWLSVPVTTCAESSDTKAQLPDVVGFNAHIRPIFAKHCVGCHGGPKQASGISFIYRDSALAEAESGDRPIVPGKPDESQLLARVTSRDDDYRMPPADHGPPLGEREIALFQKWIEQGAKWEEHWSFIPPKPQPLPEGSTA